MLVKWQRERFSIDFPGPDTPLSCIRTLLSQLTHLPTNAFKLIHAGAVMKDDAAPLCAYRLGPQSTIVLIGHDVPLPPPPPSAAVSSFSGNYSEQAALSIIQGELTSVRSQLTPHVHAFVAALNSSANPPPTQRDHSRLGELLLQSLLRLDAINPDREWTTARVERKAAVQELQELLESLDTAWLTFSGPSPPQ